MSAWDSYITNMKAKGLQICGIYGKDGNVWAQSPELQVNQKEIVNIVSGIKAKSFPEGVYLNGMKYTVIVTIDDAVTAKCRQAPTDAGKYLVHVALAGTCAVVGGIAGAAERSACQHVEEIRDHLKKNGY